MKIGVMSDSHGDQAAVKQAVAAAGQVDLWLHAGDYSQDVIKLSQSGVEVIAVAGNCDGAANVKPDEFITVMDKKIWLTHGHRFNVKHGHQELIWWAKHYEVDIVIFGHTHIPEVKSVHNLLIVNPGSVAKPRWGYPTIAVLEIVDQTVDAQIIEII